MSSASRIRRFICNYARVEQRKDPESLIRLARHLERAPLILVRFLAHIAFWRGTG
jgi:hypothetical protein